MSHLNLKPNHAPVKAYFATLQQFAQGKFDNEGNIRRAFEELLTKCARQLDWFLVSEYQIIRNGKQPLRVDAALLDAFNLPRGYWEAKDEKDSLHAELAAKFAAGYPRTNILIQKPTQAILIQDAREVFNGDILPAKTGRLSLPLFRIPAAPSGRLGPRRHRVLRPHPRYRRRCPQAHRGRAPNQSQIR